MRRAALRDYFGKIGLSGVPVRERIYMSWVNGVVQVCDRVRLADRPPPRPGLGRKQLGPRFDWLDEDRIRIRQGVLEGQAFGLRVAINSREVHVCLQRDGIPVGRCFVDRDGPEADFVIWYVWVQASLQRKGLASLMVHAALRPALEIADSASFAVRMIRLIKPGSPGVSLQNPGIGVIAHQLGFTPETELASLLNPSRIQQIRLVAGVAGVPPAYQITRDCAPLVLVAFPVDPITSRPFPAGHEVYREPADLRLLRRWAGSGMLVVGNNSYFLRIDGISRMADRLAANQVEADVLARRIRPLD
jgi:hypothetical protein